MDVKSDSAPWLRLLLDSASEAFYTVDCTGATTLCNAAFTKMLGFRTESEALGKKLHDLIHHSHPDGSPYPRAQCPIYQCARTGDSAHVSDELFFRLDGTAFPVEYWVRPIIFDEKLEGAICTFIDITDRREAEDQIKRNHATFYNLIQNNPFGIYVIDADFRVAEVSLGSRKVFENVRPLLGRDFAEVLRTVWAEPFASEAIARFRHTLETGEPYTSPSTVERRGDIGDVEAYDWRIERVELPDGRNGVVCYFYDLSEHLRMEAAVRDASERIALALDAGAIAGTWVWDVPNDRFTADERFARSFGQDPEACRQGLPLSVVAEPIHPQDWPKTQALLQNALKRGGSYRAEYRVKQSDGSYRWVEAVGRCDLDEKGQPDRFPGVLVDIDARKQDEAALRKSEARLRDLNATLEARVAQRASELEQAQEALRQSQKLESMGQLTGGVAHDFNNLLTPIIGGLDMLQRRSVGDARAQRTIEGALTSAERAKTLVQRLLAFARRQPLQPKAIDVDELIRDMSRLLETTLGPRVSMQLKISENLPLALADANQLEMALLNLVLNARDAMPDGGSLTIAAEPIEVAKNATGYVQLSVRDTGSGMDTETVRRAVEPFFSTKGVGQGTGLGLSMVHGLAAQLGGELSIESTPGKGTTIKLKLKQASEDHRPPEDVAPGAAYVGAGVALLVDDEDLVRASTAEMLAEIGYDVVEASSAEAALKQFQSGLRPSLLITDHLMPGMTGTELAQLARKLQPHLPVLVISGYAEVDGISADLPRLTKPFRHLELEASIAQVVSQ